MKFLHFVCVFSLVWLLGNDWAFATLVSGKVTGKNGEELAYANVYVKGSSIGTTTNIDGFYKLELAEGPCELVFRYIGYKMRVEPVVIRSSPLTINIELERENYTLNEVNIKANYEDPAYPIIRKAMEKRKFYLNQVDEYSCDVYIKGLQKITKSPEKFFGVDVDLSEFVDSITGIVYLSESVSKFHFKKPDGIKEVMISSKVSGSNRAFSFNQASDMDFNFYENIIDISGLSERGFVSPISASAMIYYRYRLDGSFLENGHWVNRIEVIPKRKSDPVFAGYIYIQDSTWRIHSTDLYLTKESQVQFVDTLRVNQTFIPVTADEDIWLKGSVTFRFIFSAFGFEGNGNFVGVFSGYDVNPAFKKKFFKGDVMKINEDANKRDTTYWEKIRPIPLTLEEFNDYGKRDSLQVIKESEPYLDSLDKVSNKFKFGNLLRGYTYQNRYADSEWEFSSMLENVQFNTVEGLNIGLGINYRREFETNTSFESELDFRYGFSNEKLSGQAALQYNWNIKKFAFVRIEGGDDLVQFNEAAPISPFINTGYTLFAEENYMKLFKKSFGKISARMEPLNGIRLSGGIEWSERSAVLNTTDYTWVDSDSREYTSNNPLDPNSDTEFFTTNQSLKVEARLRLRIRQKYVDRPDMNYILGSKYPTFEIGYLAGVDQVLSSDVHFGKIELGVYDNIKLGMFGKLNYVVTYGNFLSSKKMYFMDAAHFNGNQTIFSGFERRRFDMLEYYQYSTINEYVQVFTEHEFGGFILNKIPLIRKLKLNEIAGFRYLYVQGLNDHYEISFGFEKLRAFRADVVWSIEENGATSVGFVLGIKQQIGR